MPKRSLRIISKTQVAELWEGARLLKTYVVSTAANGLSCNVGSNCTPTGKLQIAQKIGADLPIGAVLKSRVPTGDIWSTDSSNPLSTSQDDLVLTRILWLSGIEPENSNTLERYIYLHGTNQEHLLGTPASHGCIRFSNLDIVELFDLLSEGSEVEIT